MGNCYIADKVEIGRNVSIGANCTIVEENVWVAPSVSVRDGIQIGKDSLIGLGAVVTKNIPDGEIWVGNPAKKIKR